MSQADDQYDNRRISQILEETAEILVSWVIPIYEDHRQRPSLVGTGFFVTSSRGTFLVSAGHVLTRTRERTLYYFVEPKTTCKISGQVRISKAAGIDVGVLKPNHRFLPPYQSVKKFPVGVDSLKASALPRWGKHYFSIGFPTSRNRSNPAKLKTSAQPYAHHGRSVGADGYVANQIDPTTHIAIAFDRKNGVSSRGQPVMLPMPRGMSRSPVWLLHEDDGPNTERTFPVVGVLIEYRQQPGLLIGTDIGVAMEMMR